WLRSRPAGERTEIVLARESVHLAQDPLAPLGEEGRRALGMPRFGVRQHGGEKRRFARRQGCGGGMKELPRGRPDAVDRGAKLHNVEIDLEDALLRQEGLKEHREPCLQSLAQVASAGPEEEIFRKLLGDRACTVQAPTLLIVAFRLPDGFHIEAVMKRK